MNEKHDDRPIARGAVVDYSWDWSDWLRQGDAIASAQISTGAGIAAGEPGTAGAVVTAYISCGVDAPVGTRLAASCRITTAAGRVDTRSIRFIVAAR